MKDIISNYCISLGLDTFGFTKCRRFSELEAFFQKRKNNNLQCEFEEEDIEKRINPNIYMEEGKTIISIAFPYLYYKDYKENGFSVYTRGNDYHRVVKSYLEKICIKIEALGGKAVALVDSNTLPERYIAYLANVGFIGKNNMIITKKYGSYVFLGEVITDLDLSCEKKCNLEDIAEYKECGKCNLCFKECPTKAINGFQKNCNICSSYITQKKNLEDKDLHLLNNRVFGCDICQMICPKNKEINYSAIDEFRPYEFMENLDEDFLLNVSNKEFKNTFLKTSCGWRGKNVIKRNLIIKKIKNDEKIDVNSINSEYMRGYIDRLLK